MSFLSIAFDTGNRRQLSGLPGRLAQFLGASISVWVLYSATLSRLDVLSITISFYSAMLALSFLYIAPTKTVEEAPRHLDWCLSIISLVVGSYFLWNADLIAQRITLFDPLTLYDLSLIHI